MRWNKKLFNLRAQERVYLISGFALLLIIPIWLIWIAPEVKKIPDDFSYTADILSLDNFYDEKLLKFEGPHISKTIFNYKMVKKTLHYLVIQNSFVVRTLNDRPIFSVTRLYDINPYNGQHVFVKGEKNRKGYLFGPRYANKNDFLYWHINYDAPALMKFVNTEEMDGLTVYHYQAHYLADQTVNLSYLPGVPEKRGVKTDIQLQLWIEPISGWLVKYQDNTLAYYYDRQTGKRLTPWNHFSNRYTQWSLHQQIRNAFELKWKILSVDFIVPTLLFAIGSLLLWLGYRKTIEPDYSLMPSASTREKIKQYTPYFVGVLFILIAVSSIYYIFWNRKQPTLFTIGVSTWSDDPELIEIVRGFKDGLMGDSFIADMDRRGTHVQFIIENPRSDIENQINIIQSFLHQKMNLIFTLTTPGTLIAKGITASRPIVFSDVSYPVETNMIASLESSKNNLVGIRSYIPPALQFYKFERVYPYTTVLGFVHHKADPDSEIQLAEYKAMLSKHGIAIMDIAAIDLEDLRQQLEAAKGQYNTLFVACDTLIQEGGGKVVAEFSKQNKIPSFSCDKGSILNGILMGYVADPYIMGKLAGKKGAFILQGAEPRWLSSESLSPEQESLIINLDTAHALGIIIPAEIMQQATYIVKKQDKR